MTEISNDIIFNYCVTMTLGLVFVFLARYLYFGYKYDTYVEEKYPKRAKEFRVSPFSSHGWHGIESLENMYKQIDIDDANMVRLQAKVRNSITYIVLCIVLGLCVIPLALGILFFDS